MEENNEYIQYIDSRLVALQETYNRYKESEKVANEEGAIDSALIYNGIAASVLDTKLEVEHLKEIYKCTHKTEIV